ncbi:MAG: YIP1 family protein [Anaerolineae bacterium]|nr:YIP1 family protein [Anaerolineae bacterium]
MDRIMGVLMLRAPTYREIADDPNATRTAGIIVAVVALLSGFAAGFVRLDPNNPQSLLPPDLLYAVVAALVTVVFALIAWFVSAWVLAFVARWFGGKTNTKEMLRVTGFVEIFAIASLLTLLALVSPVLLCLVGAISFVVAILRLVGYIIGIREAAEFSTGNAIVAAIIAAIINFLIYLGAAMVVVLVAGTVAALVGG